MRRVPSQPIRVSGASNKLPQLDPGQSPGRPKTHFDAFSAPKTHLFQSLGPMSNANDSGLESIMWKFTILTIHSIFNPTIGLYTVLFMMPQQKIHV